MDIQKVKQIDGGYIVTNQGGVNITVPFGHRLEQKVQDWLAAGGELTPETIDKLAILKDYKTEIEEGGITLGGMFVPTDEKTERRIIGSYALAQADPDYTVKDWTTDGGETSITLNAATCIALGEAVNVHMQKCFSAMTTVRADLENLETEQEIKDAFDAAYNGT